MSRALILLMMFIPVAAFARDKHKVVKLPVSRWREMTRMGLDSSKQAFDDTFYVAFLRKDSFSYHNRDGFVYNGGYKIDEDSIIDFGTAKLRLSVKRPTMLVLVDDKMIHVMGLDIDTFKTVVLEKEDSALPVKSIEQMIGHWTVYKKVTDKPAESVDFGTEIKAVYITGPSSDGKQGFVYGGLDPNNYPSWYIKALGSDQVLECAGKGNRIIKVTRCQKGELVLEDDGIKYYLKQFK